MTPHRPGFTGSTIDRADHLRLDSARIAELMGSLGARLLRLSTLDPELDEAGRLVWAAGIADDGDYIFLGMDGDVPLFAPLPQVETGQRAWSVFGLLGQMAPEDATLWGAARSLIEWHNRHGYCGNCGSATRPFRAGWGRSCSGCGAEHFPRVDPVVIMLAEYRGKILLGRQHQYPHGRYSALAGFVEPGESIEEAVARELREEAGVEASNIRYVASQPWPFPGSLMIGCIADAASDAIVLDDQELESAIWADAADVRAALAGDPGAPFAAPPPFAIAHSLLLHWLAAGAAPA